jgi:hypothetical protein
MRQPAQGCWFDLCYLGRLAAIAWVLDLGFEALRLAAAAGPASAGRRPRCLLPYSRAASRASEGGSLLARSALLPSPRTSEPAPYRGRASLLPNLARMYTLGLDTIAGAKLLQLKFGSSGVFQPDQAVMHGDRRARFIRFSNGAAMIRGWGDSQPVAVAPETLSLLPATGHSGLRPPAGAAACQAGASPERPRLVVRAEMGRLPRHHPRRRPQLRP